MGVIDSFFDETAYYAPLSSVDDAGDESYGTPVQISVLHIEGHRTKRDESGQAIGNQSVVWTGSEVPEDALFWPPGKDETDESVGVELDEVKGPYKKHGIKVVELRY